MANYLIDYENVHVNGLVGLEERTKEDMIIIFYSSNSDSLNFLLHQKLIQSQAKIEYIKIEGKSKNSLDFHLVSYMGYLLAQNPQEEFVIISKDNGYQGVVEFWKKKKMSISTAYNLSLESKKVILKKLHEAIPQYKEEAAKILSFIEKYKTKQGINNALVKEFGSEKAGSIYKSIKPFLIDKQIK